MAHEQIHNLVDPENHAAASGHLVPGASGIYDLGSVDTPWRSLYVTDGSIYLNNEVLNIVDGYLVFNNDRVVLTSAAASGIVSHNDLSDNDQDNHPQYVTHVELDASGYVHGPDSAIVNRIPIFDNTSGKSIVDSGVAVASGISGGSIISMVPFTVDPSGLVAPNDLYMLKDGSDLYLKFNDAGTIKGIQLT